MFDIIKKGIAGLNKKPEQRVAEEATINDSERLSLIEQNPELITSETDDDELLKKIKASNITILDNDGAELLTSLINFGDKGKDINSFIEKGSPEIVCVKLPIQSYSLGDTKAKSLLAMEGLKRTAEFIKQMVQEGVIKNNHPIEAVPEYRSLKDLGSGSTSVYEYSSGSVYLTRDDYNRLMSHEIGKDKGVVLSDQNKQKLEFQFGIGSNNGRGL